MYFVSAVTGQLITAALLDHIGFLSTPVRRFSRLRGVGLSIVLLGCALSIVERVKSGNVGWQVCIQQCHVAFVLFQSIITRSSR